MSEAGFALFLLAMGALTLGFDVALRRLAPPNGADFVARFARHVPVAWAMIGFGVFSLIYSSL